MDKKHPNSDASIEAQRQKNKPMNDWIQSKLARRITLSEGQTKDPVQALHAEVRELRRDIARGNGEAMPDSLEPPPTLNDFIRQASNRGRIK